MKNLKYLLLAPLLAVLILPNFVSAMTVEELTAKIKELEQQIMQLKAQLAQLQGETPGWCYDFSISLKIGNEGKETEALHTALEKEGFVILAEEKLNKQFGESTASAVSGFQQKYLDEILTPWGLKYGTGFAGPTTRTKLNSFYGCETKEATTSPSGATEVTPTSPTPAGQIAQIAGDYVNNFCIRKIDGSVFCRNKETGSKWPAIPGLTDAAGIFIGGYSSYPNCAIKKDGSAVCWGNNKYGQLGDGTVIDRQTPTPVLGLGPGTTAAIAQAMNHTCALKTNGSVVCWGLNANGQLGDGTIEEKLTPIQVSGLGPGTTAAIFTDFDGNPNGTCALKTNGSVVCWGEIAPIGFSGNTTPVKISQITPGTVKSLEFGFKSTFVLKKDGSVIGWGSNYCGQVGIGTNTGVGAPTQVFGLGPGSTAAISTGSYNSCALKTDGSVVCWGCNNSGEVGDGTTFPRYKPVQVPGLGPSTTAAIAVGANGGCALKTDGSIVCWPDQEKDPISGYPTGKLAPTTIPGLEKINDPNALKCSDGTFYDECSATKPKYCFEGVLKDDCATCGCDTGLFCLSHINGSCSKEKK